MIFKTMAQVLHVYGTLNVMEFGMSTCDIDLKKPFAFKISTFISLAFVITPVFVKTLGLCSFTF